MATKKGARKAKASSWKGGWNQVTIGRESLVKFLNQLSANPYQIPTIHIHIIPSIVGLVDVVFFCIESPEK